MKKFLKIIRSKKFILIFLVAFFIGLVGYVLYARAYQVMPQSAVWLLDNTVLPQDGQKVLVFSPHPDDETIGAGGYIAQSIKAGAEVKIVLVTDGNKHGIKEKRYDEFKKATSILGVKESNLIFLNFPDGGLDKIDQNALQTEILLDIKNFSPQFVIFPNPEDEHHDHALTGKIVSNILDGHPEITGYEYLIHERKFPQPKKYKMNLYLLPPVKFVSYNSVWTKLMLPDEIENQKNEAIKTYKSQLRVPILRSTILTQVRKNELFLKK